MGRDPAVGKISLAGLGMPVQGTIELGDLQLKTGGL